NTGRLRDQWHGMSRTGTLGRLFGHVAEPSVELHPEDMARLGVLAGELVQVSSRRGTLFAPASADAGLRCGQAHMAMHWGEEALSGVDPHGQRITGVNALTLPDFCPKSKQPELKHAAVSLARADLPWRLLALAWLPLERALAVREQLKPWMGAFAFTSCVPFGRETEGGGEVGLMLRAASPHAPEPGVVAQIQALFGVDGADVMRYDDPSTGQHRAVRVEHQQREDAPAEAASLRVQAFVLAGDTAAEAWLRPLLQDKLPADAFGRALLSPGAQPPVATEARGKQVCTCFNVSETAIVEVLKRCEGGVNERLGQLQSELKCGTNCGSCLPALRKLAQAAT
ncbi:MAG: (2Fe-2S)-binding protein, partial [Burkholderiales bacterium]|nr:(2Fe-2S)-binding protein [Burkholderiales bacterium]